MSSKPPAQDLNSKILAKKLDDWFFQENDIYNNALNKLCGRKD